MVRFFLSLPPKSLPLGGKVPPKGADEGGSPQKAFPLGADSPCQGEMSRSDRGDRERWHGEAVTDEGAGLELRLLCAGEFRRLRAATYFAHGGKVGKTPPGTAPDEHFVLIVAFPRTPFTGVTPWDGQNISGAQNLSECLNSRRATGPWVCKICSRCGSWPAPKFIQPTLPGSVSAVGAGPRPARPGWSGCIVEAAHWAACRFSEPHLSPTHTKARSPPGGAPPKSYRTLSGSGNRMETSQLNHPRLCVD